MKIPDELLVELVKDIAGSDTIKLLDILKVRKNVSEFKIAEKLEITVNQVRNMIYRFQEYNLVTFTRKKDKVKGWYIYYWTFEIPKAVNLILDMKTKEITNIESELSNIDDSRHYFCKPCRTKISEEEALESQFFCEICGEILEEQNSEKRKKELIRILKKDKLDLEVVTEFVDYHKKLSERALERVLAKEKAEKDKARAKKRAAKMAMKKTSKKKPVKKKVVKQTPKKKPVKKKVVKQTPKKKIAKMAAKKIVKKPETPTLKPDEKKGIFSRVFRR